MESEELLRLRREVKDLIDRREWQGALGRIDRMLEIEPSADYHYNRGKILCELSRLGEALEAFRDALKLKPASPKLIREMRNLEGSLRESGEDRKGAPSSEGKPGEADRPVRQGGSAEETLSLEDAPVAGGFIEKARPSPRFLLTAST